MSYVKNLSIATKNDVNHIPKVAGDLWFVDAGVTASGNGKVPHSAFKTIGEAITAASSGDVINVKTGTYTETGLDLSVNSVTMVCETGVTIQPASGTAFTLSGNFSSLVCPIGTLRIIPAANQTWLRAGIFIGM